MLEILKPGVLTTVQDAGRIGWARYGVPPSGPMDHAAFAAANALVGNAPDAAGLEITVAGPALRVQRECLIAVCGADFDLWVGTLPVPMWHAVYVRAGRTITFGARRSGARAYLAISGGIALTPYLGSQSTYLKGGFGGLEGRALRAGDVLPLGTDAVRNPASRAGRVWPVDRRPPYSPNPTVRVVLGPQDDHFTDEGIETFLDRAYEVTPASDRMGIRFRREAHRARWGHGHHVGWGGDGQRAGSGGRAAHRDDGRSSDDGRLSEDCHRHPR